MFPRTLSLCCLIILLARCAPLVVPDPTVLRGQVVKVFDGESFLMRQPDGETVKVRLADIAAPLRGQPYGLRAEQVLGEYVLGLEVELDPVEPVDSDPLNAVVYSSRGTNVQEKLLQMGLAWVRPGHSNKILDTLVAQAKEEQAGLWRDEDPVAPWEFVPGESKKGNPIKNLFGFSGGREKGSETASSE